MIPARDRRRPVAAVALLALALGLGCAACESSGGDLRPWRPEDHDHGAKAGQVSGTVAPGQEETSLVDVTWRQNCARCHGMGGRGDGPEGRMNRTPDLTRPDFHDRYSDEEIASVIKNGRNKMPAFQTLPDSVIAGLVKRIRRLGGRGI